MSGVFRLLNGGSKKKEELRTILSRQIHFLWFYEKHDLLGFIFLVKRNTKNSAGNYICDTEQTIDTAPDTESLNLTLAAYALYLATGNTIYSQSICSSTILEYLRAAADLVTKLDPVEDQDPRKTDKGLIYIGIQKVINEVKRVESVPN